MDFCLFVDKVYLYLSICVVLWFKKIKYIIFECYDQIDWCKVKGFVGGWLLVFDVVFYGLCNIVECGFY